MNISFKYPLNINPEIQDKLEADRKHLIKVLKSDKFVKEFEEIGYKDESLKFLRLINGYECNIVIGSTPHGLPFSFEKDRNETTVNWPVVKNYSKRKSAGGLAHEISHEWFTHSAGGYGSFSVRLIDVIESIDPELSFLQKIFPCLR